MFEPASPGPSNGGKSRHAALRARDRGRNAAVGQGSPTLKKPLRFAYGPTVTIPVPDHAEIKIGTLLSIVRQSGLPRAVFEH